MMSFRHTSRAIFCSLALMIGNIVHADTATAVNSSLSQVDPVVVKIVGTPEPGKGLVVFFRKKSFKGGAIRFKVREGKEELGKLTNGTWFAIQTEPGTHEYVVHSETKDITHVEVETGETYFIAGEINFGLLVGRPNLKPSDSSAFADASRKLKPAKPLKK